MVYTAYLNFVYMQPVSHGLVLCLMRTKDL